MEAIVIFAGLIFVLYLGILWVQENRMLAVLRILSYGPQPIEFLSFDCKVSDRILIKLEEKGLIRWEHGIYHITSEGRQRV